MRRTSHRIAIMTAACALLTLAGGFPAWALPDDSRWDSLSKPSLFDARILTVMEFQGSLIVGGEFTGVEFEAVKHIGAWDGAAWHPLGAGFNQAVSCLDVYQGDLIAGGWFTESGGIPTAHVARWNGSTWEPMGEGFDASPTCFVEWNGTLVAGGWFHTRGEAPDGDESGRGPAPDYGFVARWDGAAWVPMGGISDPAGLSGPPRDLMVYQGSLYATGSFGGDHRLLARWDGSDWAPTGPRIDASQNSQHACGTSMTVWDSLLIVGGSFASLDSNPVRGAIAYDGASWTPMNTGWGRSILVLHVVGNRLLAGCGRTCGLIEWDGSSWNSIVVSSGKVRSFASFRGLLVCATYDEGGQIVAWDGSREVWLPKLQTAPYIHWPVRSLSLYHDRLIDTSYPQLFRDTLAGLSTPGASAYNHEGHGSALVWNHTDLCTPTVFQDQLVAWTRTWDGSTLGTLPDPPSPVVRALTSHEDRLIAGGWFPDYEPLEGVVASWDGTAWTPMGQGLVRKPDPEPTADQGLSQVGALTTYQSQLIAGGRFDIEGDSGPGNVAAWSGARWVPLGEGPNELVTCFATYHGTLIAGGFFDHAGGQAANHIAQWDGNRWAPLGLGTDGPVYALAIYNDRLVVGGWFHSAGGRLAGNVAAWDGHGWIPLGSGVDGEIFSLAAYEGDLYVGGEFSRAGEKTSVHLTRWREGPRVPTFSTLVASRFDGWVLVQFHPDFVPFDQHEFLVYREDDTGERVELVPQVAGGGLMSYLDPSPRLGPLTYWVSGVGSTGAETPYASVEVSADPELRLVLHHARPNPFGSGTRIDFDTAQSGPVRIVVYDLRGRLVTKLLDQPMPVGSHTVQWDGRDAAGRPVASGAYFCRLSSTEGVRVQQLVRFTP